MLARSPRLWICVLLADCLLLCRPLSRFTHTGVAVTPRPGSAAQLPRRKVTITIVAGQQEELFSTLQAFGNRHQFKTIIDSFPSAGGKFLIAMYGANVEVHGGNPFVEDKYELGFYDAVPEQPVSGSILDELVSDLRHSLTAIPGAMLTLDP